MAVAGPNGGEDDARPARPGPRAPLSGTVRLFGEPAHRFARRATIGYLAQRSHLGVDAPVTVSRIVSAGRLAGGSLLGPLRAATG